MKIVIELTEQNIRELGSKYMEYRAVTQDDISLTDFYTLIFRNGLQFLNGGMVKKRLGKVVGGEFIEYR